MVHTEWKPITNEPNEVLPSRASMFWQSQAWDLHAAVKLCHDHRRKFVQQQQQILISKFPHFLTSFFETCRRSKSQKGAEKSLAKMATPTCHQLATRHISWISRCLLLNFTFSTFIFAFWAIIFNYSYNTSSASRASSVNCSNLFHLFHLLCTCSRQK